MPEGGEVLEEEPFTEIRHREEGVGKMMTLFGTRWF